MMKTPISILINDTGEIETFASVEEAELEMEAIDVENGLYVVTDADGLSLSVEVVIEEAPLF
ncbi:MAG: hypothetical protein LBI31_05005 [Zoogloeaceae bacterium]|jgi:hypothetical protein|nr:hypothetical protein [Zoogloeaceae bacterium]